MDNENMKTKKIYMSPSIKVLYSEKFMEGDIGKYSVEGDEGELAKDNPFSEDDTEEPFGLQDYGSIWDD